MKINSNRSCIVLMSLLVAALLSNSCYRKSVFEPQSEHSRIISFSGERIPYTCTEPIFRM